MAGRKPFIFKNLYFWNSYIPKKTRVSIFNKVATLEIMYVLRQNFNGKTNNLNKMESTEIRFIRKTDIKTYNG